MKKIALLALSTCIGAVSLCAQAVTSNKEFYFQYPEDQDTYVAYEDMKVYGPKNTMTELLIQFDGVIDKSGEQVRAIWVSGDGKKKDDYVLKKYVSGDTTFVYRASKSLANLDYGSNKYRFISTFKDGTTKEISMTLYVMHGHVGEKAKPVIYLYPKHERKISVLVEPQGGLTKSIPEYGKGWTVMAKPNGTLRNVADGKDYPYLFWESRDTALPTKVEEGFVVAREDLSPWFDAKLAYLGLKGREIADFKDFWIPILSKTPYAFITFYSQDRIDAEAPLTIDPKPDSIIRVYFEHKGLDKPIKVREQRLRKAVRSGFSVVEWGGRRD